MTIARLRPELRIDPTAIIDTGSITGVSGAQVCSAEAAAAYGPLFFQGEYFWYNVARNNVVPSLPGLQFQGGYAEASLVLTGETHRYLPATGAYGGIVPANPFSPWEGGWNPGAWELAGRFSTVDLNDNFTPGVPPGKTSAVGGGQQTVYAVGLNWYPNTNVRFMFDYLHGDINKKFSLAAGGGIAGTALGTPVGGNFDAVVLRSQFAF